MFWGQPMNQVRRGAERGQQAPGNFDRKVSLDIQLMLIGGKIKSPEFILERVARH